MLDNKLVKYSWLGLALCVAILLALFGNPQTAQAQSPCGAYYTVMRGDTLYAISRRCQVDVPSLLQANPAITNPNLIRVGQVLRIPESTQIVVYTVQRGDTLYSLARRYGTTVSAILRLNPAITNPHVIRVGQRIRIPVRAAPSYVTPSHEAAEQVGFTFMQAAMRTAPPADPQARRLAFSLLSREAQAAVGGSAARANYAFFIGIQDVPDQGISVEDLQVYAPTRASLIVGLNYSGSGRLLRAVNLIVENGEWKVDSVSPAM
jgi:LysM repeat protein